MKNLKKTLCLILSLAMIFSMLVINTGAAFDDQNEIQHPEAVAVLNELGVLVGYTDGTFGPADTLTRAEGATLMARLLLGPEAADQLTCSSAPFNDVAATHWAAGYIAYCASEGILDGVGNGKFNPEGTLTMAQLAKMMLCALGYDADTEGFTGSSWMLKVVTLAQKLDLMNGMDCSLSDDCSRDCAAQMALNTLEGTMVYYESGSINIESGDTSITIGGSSAKKEAANSYDGNIADDGDLQFAENYFTGLVLNPDTEAPFGRPAAFTWELDGETIYTGNDETDLLASYTTSVTEGTLYNLIGSTAYSKANLAVYVDGEPITEPTLTDYFQKNSTTSADGTGRGVLTEVYMDDSYNVTIVQINTYLAQAGEDYDDYNDSLDITVYGCEDADSATLYTDDGFDLEGCVEEDWLLVTVDEGNVWSAEPAETVSGAVSTYVSGSSITVDGSKYTYAATFCGTSSGFSIGSDIVLILDACGYVIGTDEVESSSDYVYISEFAKSGTLSSAGVVAAAYFPDATYDEIPVNNGDANAAAGWYTYTVKSTGKYALTPVSDNTNLATKTFTGEKVAIENGKLYFINDNGNNATNYKLTTATQFIVLDADDNLASYTGYANVPTINANQKTSIPITAVAEDGYATYVFVNAGSASIKDGTTSSEDYLVVYYGDYDSGVDEYENAFYVYYWALLNGEDVYAYTTSELNGVGLYTGLTYDSYGYIDDAEQVTASIADEVDVLTYQGKKAVTYSNGVISIGSQGSYALADDCSIIVLDQDNADYDSWSLSKVTNEKYMSDLAGSVYVILDDNGAAEAIYFFAEGITK